MLLEMLRDLRVGITGGRGFHIAKLLNAADRR